MKFENQQAFEEVVSAEGLNLFLGAGFSVLANNRDDEKLMLGFELKDYLINHFELDKLKSSSLPKIAAHLKRNRKGDFYYLLKKNYTVHTFDQSYSSLHNIPIANIFTTNIDDLCENIYRNSRNTYISDVEVYGYIESPGINLYKLHGSVTYTHDKEMLFGPSELSGAFLRDPSFWHTVSMKIAAKPTLFWGANLEDANIIDILNPSTIGNRPSFPKWIVILPNEKQDWIADEYSSNGYRIIRSTTEELLQYLSRSKFAKAERTSSSKEDYNRYFSKNYLKTIQSTEHPVRPIASFYQGADPMWSDILQGKLTKLSYYDNALDKILKRSNCHLIGSPGSGKTTLLMQLASSPEIKGVKFFFSDLEPEKARFFANKIINEKHVYLFIDNIADNIESYDIIKSNSNVTFITAERDLKYETVKHLLKIKKNQIIDISDLPSHDIQGICDNMKCRTQFFRNERVSLFELCYKLWSGKSFYSRIKSLVKQIEEYSDDLLEFYALMTYVRYAGISASMDMLLCYYTDDAEIDYQTIYEFTDKIYSLIDESSPERDYSQDYFTLRSKAFSELSIKDIPETTLGKVLSKFHHNVYRGIINRYDIFRRRAVDADITMKAFSNVEDGKKFYHMVMHQNASPFVKHQFSLYLWRKGHIEDAWRQIDDAYTESAGNVYSITNTHAFILFDTNIQKAPDEKGVVFDTLKRTFDVLENCLKRDQRKSYHVTTFAHNAVQYYNKYKDDDGKIYLNKAYNYLTIELAKDQYIPNKIYKGFIDLKKKLETAQQSN